MDAAESPALPQDLVFVDLETTGGNAAFHRITEVGIVRMRGGEVVEEWSSLVNPEVRIPAHIEAFTGISNAMVADAPRFAELAALVLGKLKAAGHGVATPGVATPGAATPGAAAPECAAQPSPVFVAHNARFDYAFLRAEFRRLGVNFSAKVLCTVKLSRRLFPEFPRHNLDAIMERHALSCTARHRALGDARVLGDFWRKLRSDVAETRLAAAAQAVLGAHRLPACLPAELADELPDGPGVYRFFGEDQALLYIGRSRSLRTRVLGHFTGEQCDAKEQKKARLVRRIDWLETAGDLGAQLTEAAWIKDQKPLFNQRLKRQGESYTWQAVPHTHRMRLAAFGELAGAELAGCFGVFQSPKDGRKALVEIARAHSLCLKMLGIEDGPGSCFAYQMGKCKGACVGVEPAIMHDLRLQMALASLRLKPWPYPGRVALQEGRGEYHVLDHWSYLGTAHSAEELAELAARRVRTAFDADVYRILVRHLGKHPDARWHRLDEKHIASS